MLPRLVAEANLASEQNRAALGWVAQLAGRPPRVVHHLPDPVAGIAERVKGLSGNGMLALVAAEFVALHRDVRASLAAVDPADAAALDRLVDPDDEFWFISALT